MHDLAFADASRPRPVAILGLPMRDYSIGHEIILSSKRNPLVLGPLESAQELPIEERHRAIIEAADVCCQTWEEYRQIYSRWVDRIRSAMIWWRWGKILKNSDFSKAIEDFYEYRNAGTGSLPLAKMPSRREGEYRVFGQPEMATLLNFLIIDCKTPHNEAIDAPLGESRMRYLAHLESHGGVRIINEDDMKREEERRAWESAHPENTLVLHPKD